MLLCDFCQAKGEIRPKPECFSVKQAKIQIHRQDDSVCVWKGDLCASCFKILASESADQMADIVDDAKEKGAKAKGGVS